MSTYRRASLVRTSYPVRTISNFQNGYGGYTPKSVLHPTSYDDSNVYGRNVSYSSTPSCYQNYSTVARNYSGGYQPKHATYGTTGYSSTRPTYSNNYTTYPNTYSDNYTSYPNTYSNNYTTSYPNTYSNSYTTAYPNSYQYTNPTTSRHITSPSYTTYKQPPVSYPATYTNDYTYPSTYTNYQPAAYSTYPATTHTSPYTYRNASGYTSPYNYTPSYTYGSPYTDSTTYSPTYPKYTSSYQPNYSYTSPYTNGYGYRYPQASYPILPRPEDIKFAPEQRTRGINNYDNETVYTQDTKTLYAHTANNDNNDNFNKELTTYNTTANKMYDANDRGLVVDNKTYTPSVYNPRSQPPPRTVKAPKKNKNCC